MNNIFNSPFEVSLRTLLILAEFEDNYLSADMLAATDFISIYGAAFGISEANLHGDSPFKFSEFATRRELVQQAIKNLVIKGLITINCSENGFKYGITDNGINYCDSLESDYANTYREMVHKSRKHIIGSSEQDILNMINRHSIRSLKKG
jgi:hypothetical protein